MRMETSHTGHHSLPTRDQPESLGKESGVGKQQVHNASSKVSLVVHKMLLPLLDTPLRTHVVFDAEADQAELDLMEQVEKAKPEILDDPKSFVQHLQNLVSRYRAYAGGYSRGSLTSTEASHSDDKQGRGASLTLTGASGRCGGP